jgi:hypothetical protein
MVIDIPNGWNLQELRGALLAAIPELAPTANAETGELIPTFEIDPAARKLTLPDALAPRAQVVLGAPTIEATLRDRADAAIGNLQAAYDGWSGLTAAQKDAALKLTVRATIALIRLQLRKLDAT